MILIDPSVLDHPVILRYLHDFSVADKNTARIVKFHQIGGTVVIDLQDAERRIRHLPDFTDRQCLRDGLHAFLQ